MEKFVGFLERHVQWIALGIGALFLAYVAYSNLADTPAHVTVDMGGKKVQSGEIATAISTSDGFRRLQDGMKREERVKFDQIDPVGVLRSKVDRIPDPPLARRNGAVPPRDIPNGLTTRPGQQYPVTSLP